MKHKISIVLTLSLFAFAACRSNPNKAEKLETNLQNSSVVTGTQKVGVKNDEMVVLQKEQIAERLRDLQNTVYSLEDKVYGMRKLGSMGLYGDLKGCRRKLASKQLGGPGSMTWTEPLDRVTDKEEDLKIGVDEKKDLVGVSEEYLKARFQRFQGYKQILQKRADEFEDKIQDCKQELSNRKADSSQSSKVLVSEAPKESVDKVAIGKFMCEYVRPGASLQNLMINAFAHGWLSLGDFKLEQNLTAAPLKDVKGEKRDNGFLFNGWKLAFDKGTVTVGDLLSNGKDASLIAWTYDHKGDVAQASACLPQAEGVWNH